MDQQTNIAKVDTKVDAKLVVKVDSILVANVTSVKSEAKHESLPLRLLRLFLGYIWALTLALAGVWLWLHRDELAQMLGPGDQAAVLAAACLCLAGAQFVFMLLVADDLCPNATKELTVFLKTFSGSIIWISLFWLVTIGWGWLA